MHFETIREATEAWVNGFNEIPYGICEKLLEADPYALIEVTPIARGTRVSIFSGEHDGEWGMVTDITEDEDKNTVYTVELDCNKGDVLVPEGELEADRDGGLPMWGTLWAFGNSIDNWWLQEDDGLQAMAECGFRIYEQEDYGFIFGIDGAGYDFYSSHWCPLYKARGLQWADEQYEEAS